MCSAIEYCEKRRTLHPPVYNEIRLKEYSPDLNTIGFNATDNCGDIRLDQLFELVKTLNDKLGTEDLTIEENMQCEDEENLDNVENSNENVEEDCQDIVFGKNKYKTNVR